MSVYAWGDNRMDISEFRDISKECKDLSFRQIWRIYDDQFQELRSAILSLGDKIVVESFTGTGSNILNLEHSYIRNHVLVFWNGVLQWKNEDYIETDSKTITMLHKLNSSDVIKVLIIMNDMLVAENLLNIEHIREVVDEKIDEIVEEKLLRVMDARIEEYLRIRGFI